MATMMPPTRPAKLKIVHQHMYVMFMFSFQAKKPTTTPSPMMTAIGMLRNLSSRHLTIVIKNWNIKTATKAFFMCNAYVVGGPT
mmetsp:Transcript_72498/g.125765  ORF Transcript_72498/g.125765 Transcript_72498/m.125765 type:complete len:84 (+) Transcript_72498:816-1067(+)